MEKVPASCADVTAGSEPQQKVVQAGANTRSWLRLLTSRGSGEIVVRSGKEQVRIVVDGDGMAHLALR